MIQPKLESDNDMDILALFEKAVALHQAGKFKNAIINYKLILENEPSFAEAKHLLGVAHFQSGDTSKAIQLIKEAILTNPTHADFYNNLANIYSSIRDNKTAFFLYRQALLIDQNHPEANKGVDQLQADFPHLPFFANHYDFNRRLARHTIPTLALSKDDELYQPTPDIIDLALTAIHGAKNIDLSDLAGRFDTEGATYLELWPGEHYKLLASFIKELQPKLVIEIGTATGASALALKKHLPFDSKIVTYDIIPWNEYPGSGLQKNDFDNRMEQRIVDLSNPVLADTQKDTIAKADIIFVDAAKDGQMEYFFCDFFDSISFESNSPVILFDDIQMPVMLELWRSIKHPKLDITSFGHWSGTGLVLWK